MIVAHSYNPTRQMMAGTAGEMEDEMDRKQAAKQLSNNIAKMFTDAVDAQVAEEVQSRLARIATGVGRVPAARKPRPPKPCIDPECDKPSAPRYGMCCFEHSGSYSREEKLVLRDRANQPGGKWNKEGKKSGKKRIPVAKANGESKKTATA